MSELTQAALPAVGSKAGRLSNALRDRYARELAADTGATPFELRLQDGPCRRTV